MNRIEYHAKGYVRTSGPLAKTLERYQGTRLKRLLQEANTESILVSRTGTLIAGGNAEEMQCKTDATRVVVINLGIDG